MDHAAINEAAECIGLGIDPDNEMLDEIDALDEAGGIVSWLARAYTGKDKDLPAEIEKELESIKTKEAKEKMLADIDDFIKEAEASAATNAMDKRAPNDLGKGFAMPGSEKYKARMAWMRKNAHTNALGVGHGQYGHHLAAGAVGNIVKRINALDGTIDKYIAELKKVRAKVAAHKVEG
jgi:hypothetical protein